MEFKRCSVANNVYDIEDTPNQSALVQNLLNKHPSSEVINEFLTLLAVCHTVIPEKLDSGEILYHAASPDENALVAGARRFGYEFDVRTPSYVEINALGVRQRFEVLNVLEFTSDRKRMSLIVRNSAGEIKLYCKGADTMIYERLAEKDSETADVTLRHLEEFATEGLRTLCCAMADIPEAVYEEWQITYHKASTALQFRQTKIDDAANLIENNLRLLGATAIEDKLQDGIKLFL